MEEVNNKNQWEWLLDIEYNMNVVNTVYAYLTQVH